MSPSFSRMNALTRSTMSLIWSSLRTVLTTYISSYMVRSFDAIGFPPEYDVRMPPVGPQTGVRRRDGCREQGVCETPGAVRAVLKIRPPSPALCHLLMNDAGGRRACLPCAKPKGRSDQGDDLHPLSRFSCALRQAQGAPYPSSRLLN